jgi:HTH-type transcriptional repressor of NAD biosynthesis genes
MMMNKIGLVFAKFLPFHFGHKSLIDFAKSQCDYLYVLLCIGKNDPIDGKIRLGWLLDTFKDNLNIEIRITDIDLPVVPYSSKLISKMWAQYLKETFPDVNILFTSERYGDFTAEFMNIKHILFDKDRQELPISATKIRNHPLIYWNYIPNIVKPYFVKKICICGTESTGKSVMTEKLAKKFNTNFVPDWGRTLCANTNECTLDIIRNIGISHAEDINQKIVSSNRFLFCDTGLNTTKMYSYFLFNEILKFDNWVEEASKFDLYIFLENDAPYIQDGTRLEKEKRDELRDYQYDYLISLGCNVEIVNGSDWDIRYEKAIKIIEEKFE